MISKTEFLAEVKRLAGLRNRLLNSDTGAVIMPFVTAGMIEASDATTEGHITVVETAHGWQLVPVGGESLARIEHPEAPLVRAYVEARSNRGAGDWFDAAAEIGIDDTDTATSLAELCLDDEHANEVQS